MKHLYFRFAQHKSKSLWQKLESSPRLQPYTLSNGFGNLNMITCLGYTWWVKIISRPILTSSRLIRFLCFVMDKTTQKCYSCVPSSRNNRWIICVWYNADKSNSTYYRERNFSNFAFQTCHRSKYSLGAFKNLLLWQTKYNIKTFRACFWTIYFWFGSWSRIESRE